jgi:hypothetical protein
VREVFQNRKDKLSARLTIKDRNLIVEYYDQGRIHGVRELIIVDSKVKEIRFYHEARVDGLYKRVEKKNKIIEYFKDRDDLLIYRSVRFDVEERNQNEPINEAVILKMTEKFSKNPDLPPSQSPYKKTYSFREERIQVLYHMENGRVFRAFEEFKRTNGDMKVPMNEVYQSYMPDPFAKKLLPHETFAKWEAILKDDYACLTAIKVADRELKEFLNVRRTTSCQQYTHIHCSCACLKRKISNSPSPFTIQFAMQPRLHRTKMSKPTRTKRMSTRRQ